MCSPFILRRSLAAAPSQCHTWTRNPKMWCKSVSTPFSGRSGYKEAKTWLTTDGLQNGPWYKNLPISTCYIIAEQRRNSSCHDTRTSLQKWGSRHFENSNDPSLLGYIQGTPLGVKIFPCARVQYAMPSKFPLHRPMGFTQTPLTGSLDAWNINRIFSVSHNRSQNSIQTLTSGTAKFIT